MTGLLLGLALPAAAVPLGPAAGYNVFLFEGFQSAQSETEGNIAVGGNAFMSDYSIGRKVDDGQARAVVGGDLNATRGSVGRDLEGSVRVGGAANTSQFVASGRSTNPTGGIASSLGTNVGIDFRQAASMFRHSSTRWSQLAADGRIINDYGTLSLFGSDPQLNAFELSSGTLNGSYDITINAPSGSTVLINVTGAQVTFQNGTVRYAGITANDVLWNLHEAAAVALPGTKNPRGTLLAAFADVTGGFGALDGQLIAKSFAGNIAFRNQPFDGALTVTPLPAAASFLSSGLVVLGLIARQRAQR